MRLRSYSEEDIIKGCIRNERRFQEILYRRYFDTLMGMCMRYTKDQDRAMQILNDGYLKVYQNIESYTGTGSFEGWIRRIVFRSLADHFRRENRYLRFIVFDEPDKEYKASALDNLYYEDILDCVDQLPDRSKEVFKLYAIEGFTHKEIGDALDMSEGTSKWHLSNARHKLKAILKTRSLEQHAG